MPDYNESTVSGHSWQRCCQVVIENPRNGVPSVRFDEEQLLALDGGTEVRTPVGTLAVPFDPATVIPLRDPATGELTGEVASYGAAYVLLYSAYLAAAEARDIAAQPAAPEPITQPEA